MRAGFMFKFLLLAGPMTSAAAAQEEVQMAPIVISGGIFPIEAQNYGRAFSVITAEEIAARGLTSVEDALRAAPGVSVSSSGDTMTAIRLRGGEDNHVMVLIDGVEANASNFGNYQFSSLSLSDVERIEVLRGPQSTIYGANAMSGVISITTKQPQAGQTNYGGRFEYGGQNSRLADVYFRQATERGGLAFSYSIKDDGGEDQAARNPAAVPGQDKDFNKVNALTLKGHLALSDDLRGGFTLRRVWQEYGYDLSNWPAPSDPLAYLVDSPLTVERDETQGSLWLEADGLEGRLLQRLEFTAMREGSDYFNAGRADGDSASSRQVLRYSTSFALDNMALDASDHKINAALEREEERFPDPSKVGDRKRNSTSLAVEYQAKLSHGLAFQAGLRRDFNDVFQDATSWNAALSWDLPDQDIRLRAAAGKAIVNPTLFEQFGTMPGSYQGNPLLKPEESLGYELGVDLGFASGRGNLALTIFQNDIEDLISGAGNTSRNIAGTSRRQGVEMAAKYAFSDAMSGGVTYSYTDARGQNGDRLARRPKHELGLQLQSAFAQGAGLVSVDLRHVADNWDTGQNLAKLPDFTTVNLAAHYRIDENVALTGRVVNVFDQEYSETWGYYGAGRGLYVGVSSSW